MRTITVLLCLLFLMGGSAYGDQTDPVGAEGSQIRRGRGGPPPEAFQACEGKTAGSTAQLTKPDGETVTGICGMDGERLVLRPDRPGGNSQDGRRGPPPEAYKACEGRSAGNQAQFVNPRGEMVKGTCQEQDGKLVLRPYSNKDGIQGQAREQSGEGPVER